MLSFKKAIFRVLCLCLLGGGLMANQTPKELFDQGVKSNKAKDYIQAKKYFEKSCDLNMGYGCDALGDLYQNGQGVEKNLIKAAQYASKACDLNNGGGCGALGNLYDDGKGVEKNLIKATQLYTKACELKEGVGCKRLWSLYYYGRGVEKT